MEVANHRVESFFVSEFFTKLFWTFPYFIHIIMVFIPLFLEENNLFYPDKLKSVSLSVHYLYLIRFRPILFFVQFYFKFYIRFGWSIFDYYRLDNLISVAINHDLDYTNRLKMVLTISLDRFRMVYLYKIEFRKIEWISTVHVLFRLVSTALCYPL